MDTFSIKTMTHYLLCWKLVAVSRQMFARDGFDMQVTFYNKSFVLRDCINYS